MKIDFNRVQAHRTFRGSVGRVVFIVGMLLDKFCSVHVFNTKALRAPPEDSVTETGKYNVPTDLWGGK